MNYLHEIKEGTQVRVDARVLAHDAKRLHLYLELFADGHDDAVSASEQMLLHVDTRRREIGAVRRRRGRTRGRAACVAARVRARVCGRVIGLPPRR